MTIRSRLASLERAMPRPTGGMCDCGLVGALTFGDEPESTEPTICPRCGGALPVLRIVEHIVTTGDTEGDDERQK